MTLKFPVKGQNDPPKFRSIGNTGKWFGAKNSGCYAQVVVITRVVIYRDYCISVKKLFILLSKMVSEIFDTFETPKNEYFGPKKNFRSSKTKLNVHNILYFNHKQSAIPIWPPQSH